MKPWQTVLASFIGRADSLSDRVRARRYQAPFVDAPLAIVPYLGFGSAERLSVGGRVLRDAGFTPAHAGHSGWHNLVQFYKRLNSNEIPGARVRVRFAGREQVIGADGEGYLNVDLVPPEPVVAPGWHRVELELLAPRPRDGRPVAAVAEALIPPMSARFGVISDIDDTVVWTNVTRKLRMLAMLARSNAATRKPFKGVGAFYRALRDGVAGDEGNPIFYVSSSPWNLYTPLVDFMAAQHIPRGPLLLKDFGEHLLFERGHQTHKRAAIERILAAYPGLPFVLIGDSGEQDPEIYARIVEAHPGRVRVVYIRSVNPDPARIEAIDRIGARMRVAGVPLVLALDSEAAAAHAADQGLIAAHRLADVRADKRGDEAQPHRAARNEAKTRH